jgi:hypothetical protein
VLCRRLAWFLGAAGASLTLFAAVAYAGPVRFPPDSLPPAQGKQVWLDFNPSQAASANETPSSLAFFLPAHWRFDARAVKRECTLAEAAAVRCPQKSWIGFGHVVTHVSGYLCPGGGTDAVAYMNAFAGQPSRPGDLASMVLEVELLSAEPLINDLNRAFGTHFRTRYSAIGRVFALHPGRYGIEVSFSGMPGGLTVPQVPFCPGLAAQVTRFKLLAGVVRRVKKPIVHVITVQTLSGPRTERIHDHVLIGHHLLSRPFSCPSSGRWPWQILVGFPQGQQRLTGSVKCSAIHRSRF